MIYETTGNLLRADAGILCHQTNFHGVMGAGIAKSIKDEILTAAQFDDYKQLCAAYGDRLLGHVQYLEIGNSRRYIANLFCQNSFDQSEQRLTNYDAMRQCFERVERLARENNMIVAMPGLIGCGIAGGSWIVVKRIIADVFGASNVALNIVYWDGSK